MERITEQKYLLDSKTSPTSFYGKNEEYITLIEQSFNSRLIPRGSEIKIIGEQQEVELITEILHELEETFKKNKKLTTSDVTTTLQIYNSRSSAMGDIGPAKSVLESDIVIQTVSRIIKPKSDMQEQLLKAIFQNDLVFVTGPAGTGKTYLAVATAAHFLKTGAVKKIVLSRPAVEAGESLGFLPGDFKEKIDPYLKPLYDALAEMIPRDVLKKHFEYEIIEVLPLAYMRGRTLNNAFVILDEAQNSTFMQMKMFLTRLGQNSKAVVTGDITQVDLHPDKQSGLISSITVLKDVEKIEFIQMSELDVVRHPLVKDIIDAYDKFAAINNKKDTSQD
jgi:phosphate starvation-inducible protein PhoH and related proteins